MKVRATTSLSGTSYGREPDASGFSFRRGDVYDLPSADAIEAVKRGHCQTDLTGELRRAGALPSDQELEALAALVEQPAAGPLANLRDRVSRGRNAS